MLACYVCCAVLCWQHSLLCLSSAAAEASKTETEHSARGNRYMHTYILSWSAVLQRNWIGGTCPHTALPCLETAQHSLLTGGRPELSCLLLLCCSKIRTLLGTLRFVPVWPRPRLACERLYVGNRESRPAENVSYICSSFYNL